MLIEVFPVILLQVFLVAFFNFIVNLILISNTRIIYLQNKLHGVTEMM